MHSLPKASLQRPPEIFLFPFSVSNYIHMQNSHHFNILIQTYSFHHKLHHWLAAEASQKTFGNECNKFEQINLSKVTLLFNKGVPIKEKKLAKPGGTNHKHYHQCSFFLLFAPGQLLPPRLLSGHHPHRLSLRKTSSVLMLLFSLAAWRKDLHWWLCIL